MRYLALLLISMPLMASPETYRDAVLEYGPADNCEQIGDEKVCAWTTSIGRNWIDKRIMVFDASGRLIESRDKRF